jgi:indolepyruvate ferredoxin oxidoreductase
MTATIPGPPVTLEDRYTRDEGQVLLNGTQALVRLMLTQRRLDTKRGLRTGMFVSGYPGSPLGGLDTEIARSARFLEPAGVVFAPGVNEELAATAVAGSQLLGELPGRRVDAVVGFWYGKTPGLDRAADAIRHANVSGTHHLGGAVALIGDDPMCKSSTLPGSSEAMCRSLLVPLLAPSSVYEVVELGLHAVALSRASGTWVGLKIATDIADSSATVSFGGEAEQVPQPPTVARAKPPVLLAPTSVAAEHDLMTARWDRVKAYSRDTNLNRIAFEPATPTMGIAAAGSSYATLCRAFAEIGLGEDELNALGVRLVQLRMPWPISEDDAHGLFGGLEQVLVVEDKLPFIETQLKELLYGAAGAPRILGKRGADGRELLSSYGALDTDAVIAALATVLGNRELPARLQQRLTDLTDLTGLTGRARPPAALTMLQSRTPFFCSGCPHNISTKAAADQLVGAGIGCHALVAFDPVGARGKLIGAPQMGGEGAHWIGLAPFTDDKHYTQNIGDGTFHHSGSLAVRAAVAAGANMTFRLLYNDAVAMTGGQVAQGRMDVASLTRWLAIEGVRRVVVTTAEPETYRSVSLDACASVRHRDQYTEVEAELAALEGVTVIIHDDRCATEERRMRKRNLLPVVTERVWINQRVCEGCGDCGSKSTCLSVVPVETEFGRKTQIHQASCNSDLSCLKGDCPAFVILDVGSRGDVGSRPRKRTAPKLPVELVAPALAVDSRNYLIRMPGVGGTGVVTVSQILQMAAMLDGKFSAGLDQTGLAQKGGAVISDVRIGDTSIEGGIRASTGSIDVLLGLDPLGAAEAATLAACDPTRTVAIVNTGVLATAAMVTDVAVGPGNPGPARSRIDSCTRAERNVYLDAQGLSDALFADHMPANLLMLGAAFQSGCIPISESSIIQAIELNGSGVAANLAAFSWGRAVVINPEAVDAALRRGEAEPERPSARGLTLVSRTEMSGELAELVTTRVSDLIDYQSAAYARRYLQAVESVHKREGEVLGGTAHPITDAYARGLHHLMAYKDEYEVARLHLLDSERQRMHHAFSEIGKVEILLQPPILRAVGMDRKIRLGRWFRPALKALRASKRLRGTRMDPFGAMEIRKLERTLVGEYEAAMTAALAGLMPANASVIRELAAAPELVRGYEDVKLRNVARYRDRVQELTRELTALAADQQS